MASATFFDAFQYVWAQTGNTFDWQDDQYRLGWATIGSTPPSVEQFNRVHQIADQKANWLFDQLKTVADAKGVTLSSGALTGLQQVLAAYGQTSTVDAVAGRWMGVGAFGLGAFAPSSSLEYGYANDFNLMDRGTTWVSINGDFTNGPWGAGVRPYVGVLSISVRNGSGGLSITQKYSGNPAAANGPGEWVRYGTGGLGARTWTEWEVVYTSRNLPPGRLINIQYFKTAGTFTYTPTAGTTSIVAEVVGGGGAGGGCPAPPSGYAAVSSGGCGGGYSRKRITSGFSGATITVGAGGVAVTNANGGGGGTSSVAGHNSATGGAGGIRADATNSFPATVGSAIGGVGAGGDFNAGGYLGEFSFMYGPTAAQVSVGGSGGSYFGGGVRVSSDTAPVNAFTPGAGGSGVGRSQGTGALAGGNGAPGMVIIWEYA